MKSLHYSHNSYETIQLMKNVHNSVLIIEQKNLKVFSPQINCCQQEKRIDWTFWKNQEQWNKNWVKKTCARKTKISLNGHSWPTWGVELGWRSEIGEFNEFGENGRGGELVEKPGPHHQLGRLMGITSTLVKVSFLYFWKTEHIETVELKRLKCER